jgi:hypothetical protein
LSSRFLDRRGADDRWFLDEVLLPIRCEHLVSRETGNVKGFRNSYPLPAAGNPNSTV